MTIFTGPVKPRQQFIKSPVIPLPDSNPDTIMDTIHDWLNDAASVYVNGAARTPDAGSAWTSIRQQITGTTVALRLQPPDTSTRKHQRVLVYGMADMSAHDPLHASSDVKANNRMFAAHVKDVPHGDESDWQGFDDPEPYDGRFWTRFCGFRPEAQTFIGLEIYEGVEAILISMHTATVNHPCVAFIGGDLWDGYGAAGIEEADGGRYGIATTGYADMMNVNQVTGAGTGHLLFQHAATAGRNKCHTYTPGGDFVAIQGKMSTGVSSGLLGPGQNFPRAGDTFITRPIPCLVSNALIGVLRDIYDMSSGPGGEVITSDGSATGDYYFATLSHLRVGSNERLMIFGGNP